MAMVLKHDEQGFLVGEPLETLAKLNSLSSIQTDVNAIRRILEKASLGADLNDLTQSVENNKTRGKRKANQETNNDLQAGNAANDNKLADIRSDRKKAGNEQKSELHQENPVPPLNNQDTSKDKKTEGKSKSNKSNNQSDNANQTDKTEGSKKEKKEKQEKDNKQSNDKARKRDSKGRFIKDGESEENDSKEGSKGTIVKAASDIATAVSDSVKAIGINAMDGMSEVDPNIKAMQELAQPITRGLGLLGLSGEKRKEGWFRKIFNELKLFHKDESVFSKARNKSLKEIQDKEEGGKSSGGGLLGSLLGLLGIGGVGGGLWATVKKGASSLTKNIAKSAGVLWDGIKKKIPDFLKKIPKGLGGIASKASKLLRRVPGLGTIFTLFGAGNEMADTEADESLTRAQKDRKHGKTIGGAAGSILGMTVGSIFGGPIGGIIGMMVGEWLGEMVGEPIGEWITAIREYDIPGKVVAIWESITGWISDSWDKCVQSVKDAWQSCVDRIQGVWEKVTAPFIKLKEIVSDWFSTTFAPVKSLLKDAAQLFNGVLGAVKSWLKNTFGIDIDGMLGSVSKTAKNVGNAAKNAVNSTFTAASNAAGEVFGGIGRAVGSVFDNTVTPAEAAEPRVLPQNGNQWQRNVSKKLKNNRGFNAGLAWNGGTFGGLSDAETRAAVWEVVGSESAHDKQVNSIGFMGKYQAGASWLEAAGYIKEGATEAAMKRDGYKTLKGWAESGGMTRFLKNKSNWTNGLDYDTYLNNTTLQDRAFAIMQEKNIRQAYAEGIVKPTDPPAKKIAVLKAMHLGGIDGAKAAVAGKERIKDSYKTSPLKYYRQALRGVDSKIAVYQNGASKEEPIQSNQNTSASQPVNPNLPPVHPSAMLIPTAPADIQSNLAANQEGGIILASTSAKKAGAKQKPVEIKKSKSKKVKEGVSTKEKYINRARRRVKVQNPKDIPVGYVHDSKPWDGTNTQRLVSPKATADDKYDFKQSRRKDYIEEKLKTELPFGKGREKVAMEEGIKWNGANIRGLDKEHTRTLLGVLSVRESGANYDKENAGGYLGKFQFGADRLAELGLVDMKKLEAAREKAKKQKKPFNQKKFLANPDNWKDGWNKEKFLGTPEIQNWAILKSFDKFYEELFTYGAIKLGDSQEKVMGLLMAAHLGGGTEATYLGNGEWAMPDGNYLSPYVYYNDMQDGAYGTFDFIQNYKQQESLFLPQLFWQKVREEEKAKSLKKPKAPEKTPVLPSRKNKTNQKKATGQQSKGNHLKTKLKTASAESIILPFGIAPQVAGDSIFSGNMPSIAFMQPSVEPAVAYNDIPSARNIPSTYQQLNTLPSMESPIMPMGSDKPNKIQIMNKSEIGQDVKDRQIAHIVTGGFASG